MISDRGVLTFNSPPDYEESADSDNDNVYNVTVTVDDRGDLVGGDDTTADDTREVTVNSHQRGRAWRGNPTDVAATGESRDDGYADRS